MSHPGGSCLYRVVATGGGSRCHGGEHGRPEGRRLSGGGDPERSTGHVRVDLHQHPVALGQAAAGHDLIDSDAALLEGVDDDPRTEGRGLDQGPVYLGRGRGQGHTEQDSGQIGIDQDRAVAVPPVERQQPGLAGHQGRSLLLQDLVHADAERLGSVVVEGRNAVVDEPGEDVAHSRLACFVAEEARNYPIGDDAAGSGDDRCVFRKHDVARARAHDCHERATRRDGRGRSRDVGVHVGNGDGDPRRQPRPASGLFTEPAGPLAQTDDLAGHLVIDHVGEGGIERGEELGLREAVLGRPDRLVARGAVVPSLGASQLPDHPVGSLDQAIGRPIDLRCLAQDLQRLGEEPLRGDLAAVSRQPGLPHLGREAVHVVCFGLGGVVLPELDPGVRLAAEFVQEAQRRAIGLRRQHRARREVHGDADHRRGVYAGARNDRRHRALERLEVIVGILQGPVRAQHHVRIGRRQTLVDDAVGVLVDLDADLPPVRHVDQEGARGFGPEIDSDRVARLSHRLSFLVRSGQ